MEALERGEGVFFEQQGHPPERTPSCLQESHLAAARPSFVPTLLLTRPPPFKRASSSACWFSAFFLFFYPSLSFIPSFSLMGPPCRTCTSPAWTKKNQNSVLLSLTWEVSCCVRGPVSHVPAFKEAPGLRMWVI